jgi:hypothetical protein
MERDYELARTPSLLKPLIKEQVELGDLAASQAGWPYYVKAGGLLLEAQPGVKVEGKQTFVDYCEEATGKNYSNCNKWINAFKQNEKDREHARNTGKSSRARKHLRGSVTPSAKGQYRPFREWTETVDDAADRARKQQEKEASDRAAEQKLKQQLARQLIKIGFDVLAKTLHPDKMGGNKDAMARLNEVKRRLLQVYG